MTDNSNLLDIDDLKLTKLYKMIPNKFLLSVAVAKRARQLKDGARPLENVSLDPLIPVVAALHEITSGKVHVGIAEEVDVTDDLLVKMDQELEVALEKELSETEEDEKATKKEKESKRKKSLSA